jgi:agmatine deiminase
MDYPAEFRKFRKFLESYEVTVKVLNWTNDIYCRDYMPVQVDEHDFVQFVFKPDSYFKRSEIELITNPVLVHIANKLQHIRYSNVILDGGNVVKWKDKVIITDKVYDDNRYQFESNDAILNQLEEELKCRVVIIPRYPGDNTGHADGLVRFIDENTVFINDPLGGSKKWQRQFLDCLNEHQLDVVKLPCTMKDGQETGDGLFINYLHVGKSVVVPQFGPLHADKKAIEAIEKELGRNNNVVPYPSKTIAKHGGVLNCATWTIRSNSGGVNYL